MYIHESALFSYSNKPWVLFALPGCAGLLVVTQRNTKDNKGASREGLWLSDLNG